MFSPELELEEVFVLIQTIDSFLEKGFLKKISKINLWDLPKTLLIKSRGGHFFTKQSLKFGLLWASWIVQSSWISCPFENNSDWHLLYTDKSSKNYVFKTYTVRAPS